MEFPGDWVLVAMVLAAAGLDLKCRRIPNRLTVSGFVIGLAFQGSLGAGPMMDGLAAALIAFALSVPVFALGGLGGGDVKLLTAAGVFLGLDRLWGALLVTVLVGGAFALAAVLKQGRTVHTMANLYVVLRSLGRRDAYTGWKGEEGDAPLTIRSAGVITRPYGVAIAAGSIYAVLPFL